MKMTQREMVVRYLLSKRTWVFGHDLVKNTSSIIGKNFIIQDADTRAHELVRDGFFDSKYNRYYIEHRKSGRYAQFRISRIEKLPTIAGGRYLPDYTYAT